VSNAEPENLSYRLQLAEALEAGGDKVRALELVNQGEGSCPWIAPVVAALASPAMPRQFSMRGASVLKKKGLSQPRRPTMLHKKAPVPACSRRRLPRVEG
jgi:hypothetical protein